MNKKLVAALLGVLLAVALCVAAGFYLQDKNIAVLNPAGEVASKERDLITTATILSLIICLPVFVLTFFIVWRYREGNHKSTYQPEWDHSRLLESIWWGVPCIIILILGVITWRSSHELDPFKPLTSSNQPITIQVVALEWRWLFIYPDQDIATVNYVQFPEDTPINFRITADAPMNSFWIPQLGGQIYAMAGMETKLHLMADKPGVYDGLSANLSGDGFASMRFKAEATSRASFDDWVADTKKLPRTLTKLGYIELAKPNTDGGRILYSSREKDLYDTVIKQFTTPLPGTTNGHGEHETTKQTSEGHGHH